LIEQWNLAERGCDNHFKKRTGVYVDERSFVTE